jgi:hypothetical protein
VSLQDKLIEFLLAMHDTHTSAEAMAKVGGPQKRCPACMCWGIQTWPVRLPVPPCHFTSSLAADAALFAADGALDRRAPPGDCANAPQGLPMSGTASMLQHDSNTNIQQRFSCMACHALRCLLCRCHGKRR